MNEKIKQLAEQAWVYQMTVYEYDGVRTYGERELVFSKEKFAELIIKECIDIVSEQSARRPEYRIKQHFGVDCEHP